MTILRIQIPRRFFGAQSSLEVIFELLAFAHGDSKEYSRRLLRLVPKEIRDSAIVYDRLTKLWRYEYCAEFDQLPGGMIISGTNVYRPVEELYSALRIAKSRLRADQLPLFVMRMSDRAKHVDTIFEMRPAKDLGRLWKTGYEISGLGQGNTSIDWQIQFGPINVLLEVKHRTKSLIEHMKQIMPAVDAGDAGAKPMAPDPSDLFKDVEAKFREVHYLSQLQGVWICSHIKEDEERLRGYFATMLSPKKIHFVVLSDWKDDAFILSRNRLISLFVRWAFRLRESSRFVAPKGSYG